MKKPMRTSEDLVLHMKDKGISFTIISEDEAKKHLAQHNNYFKLTSYRKNYTKYTTGAKAGKYEFLEFAYLRELARIDVEVRHLLLEMALDIEHFLKVMLITEVERQMLNGEDGYQIIKDYTFDMHNPEINKRAENASKRTATFNRKVSQNKKNPYCSGLVEKYASEMPVWAYVELISFGDLKDLIQYYSEKTGWKLPVDIKSIDRVRQLRNACAHGNAIINDLRPVSSGPKLSEAPLFITNYVAASGISKTTRMKKLSNPRINQITHLLYVYDNIVTSEYTRKKRIEKLDHLINTRIVENKVFFKTNQMLISTYKYFKTICNAIK